MLKEISLRIEIQKPINGVAYGLQKGKGPNYEVVQAQLGNGHDITFDFTAQVKESNGSPPTLAGTFVQGPAGNRFIYITVGTYAGQTRAPWSGRMKIPLPEATFQNTLSEEGNSYWSCTVPATNETGKPVFATVKPFSGWVLRN